MFLLLFLSITSASILDVATSVGEYLKNNIGVMNSTDDAPRNFPYLNTSLYYGPPGVSIYFLQLAQATNDQQWVKSAESSLESIVTAVSRLLNLYGNNIGFYYGLAGIAYSLRLFGYKTASSTHLEAAKKIEDHVLSISPFSMNESAPLWNNTDIAHGVSGTGLYLLWVARKDPSRADQLVEAATRGGAWLLSRMEATDAGARWPRGPDTDGDHENQYFPTFCCGTSGVSYFLATLFEETRSNSAFLDAAKSGLSHIVALGVYQNSSLLIPHEEEGSGLKVFYMGWCGGPVGWSRLFVKLYQVTQDPSYLELIQQALSTIFQFVEPDLAMYYPPGSVPWRNLGQCCGASGAGRFLLSAANSMSWLPLSDDVKKRALKAANNISRKILHFGIQTQNGGMAFPSPEEHLQPLETTWQAGWMQGAAGITSFLLSLYETPHTKGESMEIIWPDDPWK